MNWIFKNIGEMIADALNGVLDFFGDFVTDAFTKVTEMNMTQDIVVNASNFILVLALLLLVFMLVKRYFDVYVMGTDGDPDQDPVDLLVRAAQAVVVICTNELIFTLLMQYSSMFAEDLAGSATAESTIEHAMDLVMAVLEAITQKMVIFLLFISILCGGLIVFVFMAGLRGAELTLMKLLLPLFCMDLLSSSREKWNRFFMTYLSLFLSYGIQLLCFRMFCMNFVRMKAGGLSMEMIVTFGWLVMMLKTPKFLSELMYATGISRTMGGAVKSGPFMLMRLKGAVI